MHWEKKYHGWLVLASVINYQGETRHPWLKSEGVMAPVATPVPTPMDRAMSGNRQNLETKV